MVDNAYVIDNVDYDEIFQLAEFGAKYCIPVRWNMRKNVPVTILNVGTRRTRQRYFDIKRRSHGQRQVFGHYVQGNCTIFGQKYPDMNVTRR